MLGTRCDGESRDLPHTIPALPSLCRSRSRGRWAVTTPGQAQRQSGDVMGNMIPGQLENRTWEVECVGAVERNRFS